MIDSIVLFTYFSVISMKKIKNKTLFLIKHGSNSE